MTRLEAEIARAREVFARLERVCAEIVADCHERPVAPIGRLHKMCRCTEIGTAKPDPHPIARLVKLADDLLDAGSIDEGQLVRDLELVLLLGRDAVHRAREALAPLVEPLRAAAGQVAEPAAEPEPVKSPEPELPELAAPLRVETGDSGWPTLRVRDARDSCWTFYPRRIASQDAIDQHVAALAALVAAYNREAERGADEVAALNRLRRLKDRVKAARTRLLGDASAVSWRELARDIARDLFAAIEEAG